jgi:rubrerythrin
MDFESQNNVNNPQMELAMQQMIEAQTQLALLITRNMSNNNGNELPPGVQQLLDEHDRIMEMMSQTMAINNNNMPLKDHGLNESEDDDVIITWDCKICGAIGHAPKECHEHCPNCETSHPIGECRMTEVTCFCVKESVMFLLNVIFTT